MIVPPKDKKKNLLVIGGNGYMGRSIIHEGLKQNYKIDAITLHDCEETIPDVSYHALDIGSDRQVKEFFADRSFNYVVNTGGYVDHSLYSERGKEIITTHLMGVINICSSIDTKELVNFINIGSSWEYGMAHGPHSEILREDSYTPYAFAKTAAAHFLEMLHRNENFPSTTLRCFLTFGPGQKLGIVPSLIEACLKDKEFPCSDGQSVRDLLYIDDFVASIFACFENQKIYGKTINIGSGIPIKIAEVINLAISKIGGGKPLFGKYIPEKTENPILFADIERAQDLLNWAPKIGLEEGMVRVIDWHKEKADISAISKPLISIIINCFNGEKYLKETLDSIQAQTYENYEVIFWDNQSSDSSAEIFREYQSNPRFKYFLSDSHTNLYTARSSACKVATGDFFSFLDCDDYWTEDKLEKQIKLFDDPDVGFSCSNFKILHEIKKTEYVAYAKDLPQGAVSEELAESYFIGLLTLMIRADAYRSLSYGFDESFKVMGDLDLTFRLSKKWKIASSNDVLGTCRKHGNNALVLMRDQHITEFESWLSHKAQEENFFSHSSLKSLKTSLGYMRFLYFILNERRKQAVKTLLQDTFNFKTYIRCIIMIFLPLKIIKQIKND